MKPLFIILASISMLLIANSSQAQLLKKLKNKVNKTINSAAGSESSEAEQESSPAPDSENDKKTLWCDTVDLKAGAGGVEYSLAYSSPGKIRILYDESSLGLGSDENGYRMILSEKAGSKEQFIVVENGKVIATDTKVDNRYIVKGSSGGISTGGEEATVGQSKYIIGDTLKQDIPESAAKSVTINKVEDDQFEMAMAMARETDDYKKMSDAEKKEFERMAKEGMAKHNAMAGTTVAVPEQQGGTVAMVTGYNLVVKGKNYGKFQAPPHVEVSKDESRVFAVGVSDKGVPVLISNGKKTMLDKDKFTAMTGRILKSADKKTFVYIEQKKMTDAELEAMTTAASSGKPMKLAYNVIRPDGSSLTVTDHNSSGQFLLTNAGQLVCINERTGQVYADNKAVGKFTIEGRDMLDSESILIGNDINQAAYYNGNDGSLTYLDGTIRKLNITFPRVISQDGKSYLTWFRKCRNDIYIAKFAY